MGIVFQQTLRFLEDTPCKFQTKESLCGFLEAVKPFELTKAESLLIANDPPTTPLHIQLLLEDSEERFTEDEVNRMIGLVREHLLPKEEVQET